MDFFLLKKLVSLFLHLIPGCLVLIFLALLLRYTRFQRLATTLVLFAVITLFLASTPVVSNKLISSLEDQFPPMITPPGDTTLFLTLGNYANEKVNRPANLRLEATSLARITETIRLWKQQSNARLYLGGPSRFAMRDLAVENGVAAENIILNDEVRDTIGEVSAAMHYVTAAALTGQTVIVSSATHLPRTKLIVDNADVLNLNKGPINPHSYAPSDFISVPSDRALHAGSSYLHKTDRVLHEYVGILWIKLKVFISSVLSE